jgi:DNA-binding transcriptional ArsR family regulator
MRETEKILKALANKRRLAILKYLNINGSAAVGDIANIVKVSFKATSKHLLIMYSADLLAKDQVGLNTMYSLQKPVDQIVKVVLSIL